jgi:hypothetical protein
MNGQACDPGDSAFACSPRHVCVERNPGQGAHCELARCANGIDDDADGKVDYPHDPGCAAFEDDDCSQSPPGPTCPQCGNGIDMTATARSIFRSIPDARA